MAVNPYLNRIPIPSNSKFDPPNAASQSIQISLHLNIVLEKKYIYT
jgi:hypothetical protein